MPRPHTTLASTPYQFRPRGAQSPLWCHRETVAGANESPRQTKRVAALHPDFLGRLIDGVIDVRGTRCTDTSGGGGATTGLYKVELPDGSYTVRKLTPIEAERCQTLPDGYTAFGTDEAGNTVNIAKTQRYSVSATGGRWK